MRTVITRVPHPRLTEEAAKLGLPWPELTGLLVQQFEDGTSLIVVQPGRHSDAARFI